jgi:hypothetical protein
MKVTASNTTVTRFKICSTDRHRRDKRSGDFMKSPPVDLSSEKNVLYAGVLRRRVIFGDRYAYREETSASTSSFQLEGQKSVAN